MKKLMAALLSILVLTASTVQAESLFTVANKGGWYWIDIVAYKVGDYRASEGFDTFDVYLGQSLTFSSNDYSHFDVRVEVNVYDGPPINRVGFKGHETVHITLHAYGTSGSPEFYWAKTKR